MSGKIGGGGGLTRIVHSSQISTHNGQIIFVVLVLFDFSAVCGSLVVMSPLRRLAATYISLLYGQKWVFLALAP